MSKDTADTLTMETVRKARAAMDAAPVPGPEGRIMYWPEWTEAYPAERRLIERQYGFERGVIQRPFR